MKEVVDRLKELHRSISTMESCTGGYVANEITNIEGASEVLRFSAVTYSNEFKIQMGVSSNTIEQYSVYSFEVCKEMSKVISHYANSDYGIGITGKLNRVDEENPYGEDNIVFVSIYDREKDEYHTFTVEAIEDSRKKNKGLVCDSVISCLLEILK